MAYRTSSGCNSTNLNQDRRWLIWVLVVIAPLFLIGCRARCPQTGAYRAAAQWFDARLAELDDPMSYAVLAAANSESCLREVTSAVIPAPAGASLVLDLLDRERPMYVLAGSDVTWQAVRNQPWFLERYQQVAQWREIYPEPTALTFFAYTPSFFDLGEGVDVSGGFQTEAVTLRRYRLSSPRVEPNVPLYLTLFWDDQPGGDYRDLLVTVRLVAADSGQVWLTLRDLLGPSGLSWRPGARLTQRYGIIPPDDLPQGRYEIRVGLQERSGRPIAALGPDAGADADLLLASISHPPDFRQGPIAMDDAVVYYFGGPEGPITLRGVDALPWGRPGDEIQIGLLWSTGAELAESYRVFVHLLSPQGELVTQSDGVPVYGFFPTDQWPAGGFFRDVHVLSLPEGLTTGTYTVAVGLYLPDAGVRASVHDQDGQRLPLDQVALHRLTIYADAQR